MHAVYTLSHCTCLHFFLRLNEHSVCNTCMTVQISICECIARYTLVSVIEQLYECSATLTKRDYCFNSLTVLLYCIVLSLILRGVY